MIRQFVLIFLIFQFFSAAALTADTKTIIKLTDGSELAGEVVSLKKGVYSIRTESLGVIKINKTNVDFINIGSTENDDAGQKAHATNTLSQTNSDVKSQALSMAKNLMGNKDVMTSILKLQNDPDFKAVLNNPEIINAVNSGDINKLLSNPDFLKLFDNATVKDLSRKYAD